MAEAPWNFLAKEFTFCFNCRDQIILQLKAFGVSFLENKTMQVKRNTIAQPRGSARMEGIQAEKQGRNSREKEKRTNKQFLQAFSV